MPHRRRFSAQLSPRAVQRLGLGYLGADLLVLGPAGLLENAKLLVARQISGLPFLEQFGGFVVLAAEAVDAGAPPFRSSPRLAASPRARTSSSAARSNSATARSTALTSSGLTGMSRSAAVLRSRRFRASSSAIFSSSAVFASSSRPRAADRWAAASLTFCSAFATGAVRGSSRRASSRLPAPLRRGRVRPRAHLRCRLTSAIWRSSSASRRRRRAARLVAPMNSGADLGRAPRCGP